MTCSYFDILQCQLWIFPPLAPHTCTSLTKSVKRQRVNASRTCLGMTSAEQDITTSCGARGRALMPPVVHAFALASLTLKVPDKHRSRPPRHRFRLSPSLPARDTRSHSHSSPCHLSAPNFQESALWIRSSARLCALTSESHLSSLLWASSSNEHLSLSSGTVAALSIL
jgi:hypothetical protein